MVCFRCKMVVKEIFLKLGIRLISVELGEVETVDKISPETRSKIRYALVESGLELIDDKKSIIIQKIKTLIIDIVHNSEEPLAIKLSEYLSSQLNYDYTYLANIFSEVQGSTIERFFISHKIERVKELLVYNELTLTEISYKVHYSSVAHLSSQFKKLTGQTPSEFKRLRQKNRTMIEDI